MFTELLKLLILKLPTYVLGASGTFWLYGVVCLIGATFTFIFVPETKGKSIEEIQKLFEG